MHPLLRLEPKPAAAICTTAFTLLLIFGAAWPGHGYWLLGAALGLLAAAAAAWRLDSASPATATAARQRVAHSPFAAVPYSAGRGRQRGAAGFPDRVHVALVAAACALLALILFIGGALGGSEETPAPVVEHDENAQIIDLSREGEPAISPPAADPATAPTLPTAAANSASAPAAPVQTRPIVVPDPKPATPVELPEPDAPPATAGPARTVKHTVVEGDTLYEIAERYDSTVEAIMTINGLSNSAIIHPGESLIIPQPDE